MPLVPIHELIGRAAHGGYAVGYFESWDIASLQGVIDAAERSRSPVILGFNGEFLSRDDRALVERLELYAGLGRAGAESATVPCGLIFNECSNDDWTRRAIELGFNLVMPVAGHDDASTYTQRVRDLLALAHTRGVAVEAELGELPHGPACSEGEATDPDAAAAFVETTGVDLLAVSVGNVHILTHGERGLDLARLSRIRSRTDIPLVLHGGTGIARDHLKAAINAGVAKVNFGTYLKQRYLHAVRRAIGSDQPDPHRLFGLGGPEDVLVAGRHAVRDAVLDRIDLLGSRGRA